MSAIEKDAIEKELRDSFSIQHWQDHRPGTDPTRLRYHRILYIEKGHGRLTIDEQSFELKGQELFLLAITQIHTFSEKTLFTGYQLSFGDCFWERSPASANNCKAVLFNNAAANQHITLAATDHKELEPLFDQLQKEFQKEDYLNKLDAMAAWLKIIMIKTANINAALIHAYDDEEKRLYRKFLDLVTRQYRKEHEVAAFARQLSITPRKLSDCCRRCSGKGAKDIINGQLLAEAKRSLQFSSNPVKEIAYELNFSTPEQFSAFFKKNASISPQDYRAGFVNFGG
ncbi:MAG TPA: AraC family transcriptional regulator [Puia sp.]|nr:AraC family transcriptional regulator [Puia sp.]